MMIRYLAIVASIVAVGLTASAAQQPPSSPRFATPTPMPPLFFREEWKQTRPLDASTNFQPGGAVPPEAVTNGTPELKISDPFAKQVPEYLKTPPPGSRPSDWGGPSCI